MAFINWGEETPDQLARRRRWEEELFEAQQTATAALASASGSGHRLGIDFTIECWIYLEGEEGAEQEILGTWGPGDSSYLVDVTVNISVGEWHHFALVRNGDQVRSYLDGQITAEWIEPDPLNDSNTEVWIGSDPTGSFYLSGRLTNLRWTRRALYLDQFVPSIDPLTVVSGTRLLLLATNEESALFDSGPESVAVTQHGGVEWSSDSPLSQGGSIQFNSSLQQYLTLPSGPNWIL